MNIEELTEFCQSLRQVETEILWENVLVFKVGGKMFCLVALDEVDLKMNLKCDPEKAIELRERCSNVLPGHHMNKRHWNTVLINDLVKDSTLQEWIKESYNLVVAKLSCKMRRELGL